MRVELALDHLLRGGDDFFAELCVEVAKVRVRLGRSALDDTQRTHQGQRLLLPADLEIVQRSLRLRTPITVNRNLYGSKGIGFGARLNLGHGSLSVLGWTTDLRCRCHIRLSLSHAALRLWLEVENVVTFSGTYPG